MSITIVKRKHGHCLSGEEIAEKHYLTGKFGPGQIYPRFDAWDTEIISDPVDKLAYLTAELNTFAEQSRDRRRKNKCAKALRRIDNLERRLTNYVPNCEGIHHYNNWRNQDLPAKMKVFYPQLDYGRVKKDQMGLLLSFLRDKGVEEFGFILDSRYVVVLDDKGGMWDGMKQIGLVDLDEIDYEYTIADMSN